MSVTGVCAGCGRTFTEERRTRRRFCSERCRKSQYDLVCVDCGGRVDGTTPSKRPDPSRPVCAACAGEHYARWSREAILDAIRAWARDRGAIPTATEWANATDVSPATSRVQAHFGSWNAAIEAAGFEPRPRSYYGRPGEDAAVIAETVALYRSGMRRLAIARRYGVSLTCVRYRLKKGGIPPEAGTPLLHGPEVRERAIAAYRAGATLREAGTIAGVGASTVWRWVEAEGIRRNGRAAA